MTQDRDHVAYQRDYFGRGVRRSILPVDSPYVRRHLEKVLAAADLRAGRRVIEAGAGMGRYTAPMLEAGLSVVAMDLSPSLLDSLVRHTGIDPSDAIVADLAEIASHTTERFDAAVGFFMLHHLPDLRSAFRGLAQVLKPSARVAFCEPNAFNPLFYIQMALTPSMTWKGDGGVIRMRPALVLGAMKEAGFCDLTFERFGFLPPFAYNTRIGRTVEGYLSRVSVPAFMYAFQIFAGSAPL